MRASKFDVFVTGKIVFRAMAMTLIAASAAAAPTAAEVPHQTRVAVVAETAHGRTAIPQIASSAVTGREDLHFAGFASHDARAATIDSQAPAAASRPWTDLLSLLLIGAMLVAYQLFRKHRLLRQQPFSH